MQKKICCTFKSITNKSTFSRSTVEVHPRCICSMYFWQHEEWHLSCISSPFFSYPILTDNSLHMYGYNNNDDDTMTLVTQHRSSREVVKNTYSILYHDRVLIVLAYEAEEIHIVCLLKIYILCYQCIVCQKNPIFMYTYASYLLLDLICLEETLCACTLAWCIVDPIIMDFHGQCQASPR